MFGEKARGKAKAKDLFHGVRFFDFIFSRALLRAPRFCLSGVSFLPLSIFLSKTYKALLLRRAAPMGVKSSWLSGRKPRNIPNLPIKSQKNDKTKAEGNEEILVYDNPIFSEVMPDAHLFGWEISVFENYITMSYPGAIWHCTQREAQICISLAAKSAKKWLSQGSFLLTYMHCNRTVSKKWCHNDLFFSFSCNAVARTLCWKWTYLKIDVIWREVVPKEKA